MWFHSRSPKANRRVPRARPTLEALEDRLVQDYLGMKQGEAKIPPRGKVRLTEALDRQVRLYDKWDSPAEAARWHRELEARKGNEKK
jgi:hypothetical protein